MDLKVIVKELPACEIRLSAQKSDLLQVRCGLRTHRLVINVMLCAKSSREGIAQRSVVLICPGDSDINAVSSGC